MSIKLGKNFHNIGKDRRFPSLSVSVFQNMSEIFSRLVINQFLLTLGWQHLTNYNFVLTQ